MDEEQDIPQPENDNHLHDLLNDPEKIEYYLSRWGRYELRNSFWTAGKSAGF